MKKAAIYARVSTSDQQVETQLHQLRELAARRGFEVICEYTDVGVSGSRARLPGLCDSAAASERSPGKCQVSNGRASAGDGNGILKRGQLNQPEERR